MSSRFGKIKQILSTKEFNYSKDWRQSDEVGRVEWLIISVKNKSEEINRLDSTIQELLSRLEKKEEEVQYWKSLIGK